MQSRKNIGIVGAGIAGLTIAYLLKEQGHDVTLIEKSENIQAVGAGFILQPSGQFILKQLDLFHEIYKEGTELNSIKALLKNGKKLVSIKYPSGCFGLGIKRHDLFKVLYNKCLSSKVNIIDSTEILDISQNKEVEIKSIDTSYKFDVLIATDGSRSCIREKIFKTKVKEYNYSALWTLIKLNHEQDHLLQIVDSTKRLSGILPVGKNSCSFFWGINQNEKENIYKDGIEKWKAYASSFSTILKEITSHISSLEEFTHSTYRSCFEQCCYKENIILIGDAAHSSSPHLGQGVNLALEDAFSLAQGFEKTSNIEEIFHTFQTRRYYKNRYYWQLTALLTSFFQSDYTLLAYPRNIALPIMPDLPFIGNQMSKTMAGLKNSWFDFK